MVFVGLVGVAVIVFFLAPRNAKLLFPFYTVILFAAPPEVVATVPFPGLNQFLSLNFQQVASIVVAVLAVTVPQAQNHIERAHTQTSTMTAVVTFISLYCLLVMVMGLRETTLTNSIRFGIDHALSLLLMAIVFARHARTIDDAWSILLAILATCVVFSFMCILVQARGWNFYTFLDQDAAIWKGSERRFGILRTSLTVNTGLLGYMSGVAIVILLALKHLKVRMWFLPLLGLFSLACLVSLARGAWIASFLMVFSYFILKSRMGLAKIAAFSVGGIVLVFLFDFVWQNISLDEIDQYGTFSYRQEIYRASWNQFLAAPLFGDAAYLASGRFDHLVQGEGIVDIVSVYLQVVLRYGAVGLALFIAPFVTVLIALLRNRSRSIQFDDPRHRHANSVALSSLLGYLLLIGTTSDVSLVPEVGVLIVSLGAIISGINGTRTSVRHPENGSPEAGRA